MARRDKIHESIKSALIKDGWQVTDDPLLVSIDEGEKSFEIDLGAEKVISAEKQGIRIAVEVKSFGSPSILHAFHEALGQYLDYRDALEEADMDREMYLGISIETYYQIRAIQFLNRRIEKYSMKILVVDIDQMNVQQWIK